MAHNRPSTNAPSPRHSPRAQVLKIGLISGLRLNDRLLFPNPKSGRRKGHFGRKNVKGPDRRLFDHDPLRVG